MKAKEEVVYSGVGRVRQRIWTLDCASAIAYVNKCESEPRGWSNWLGSWSQGTYTGLDWVCSPVRVLLPAL